MHGRKSEGGAAKKTRERNIWRREQQRGTNSKGERNRKFDKATEKEALRKSKRAAKQNGQQRRMDQQTRKCLRMIDDNTGSERMERRRMQRLPITRNFFEATEEEIESKY